MPLPVNPNATQSTRDLLNLLYRLAGRVTLSGHHNFIGRMSSMTDKIAGITGKTPAVWGTDFGFSGTPGDIDYIGDRARLLPEIEKQHAQGALIVMTYHQGHPMIGEPCAFKGGVQIEITDADWESLLTPGSLVYRAWQKQMDLLADLFRQLQEKNIPVIFRPYHEMNGSWFWWGNRPGEQGYPRLWKQLYHYYTDHHKLNNLLWAWCSDRPWEGVEAYYPGHEYVDILGADIYPLQDRPVVYPQEWFDRMVALANGKPVALTENSVIPDEAILKAQPWLWFMSWTDMPFDIHKDEEIKQLYANPRLLGLETRPSWENTAA